MIKPGAPLLNLALESDSSEEDEDIEDIKPSQNQSSPRAIEANKIEHESTDFLDARNSIAENQWDLNSWNTMIEEVENSRGGVMTPVEVYTMATTQFPRAPQFWKKLLSHHLNNGDMLACEEGFRKCLPKCRSVDLWDCYIAFMRKKTVEKDPPSSENYGNAKKLLETGFKKAVDSVGMCLDSSIIWRRYLDFVQSWPESTVHDSNSKLNELRAVYQRAICNPMDGLDTYWSEYKALEMRAGEHYANQVLPEFEPRVLHAKTVYKDRSRAVEKLQQNRVATPPSLGGSVAEMEQLDLWNKWISFELTNPDNLSEEQLKNMILMVFERCLTCFYLHAEVWIALSRYTMSKSGAADARAVLKEGLVVLPQVPTLWFALSEFEEQHSSVDSAANVLRAAFESVPCAFTFAALQRLIRRKDGVIAARKLFSETMSMRSDGTLGFEVYVAHALLELEVNNEPQVALKVLDVARSQHPAASCKVSFLRLITKVLVRLGDVRQLRWEYQTALGAVDGSDMASSAQRLRVVGGEAFSQEEQLELWEAYLEAELTMGMSDVNRLSQLRSRVESLRRSMKDKKKGDVAATVDCDIFDSVGDIFSRCSHFSSMLPPGDEALRQRSRGALFLKEVTDKADQRMIALMDTGVGGRRRHRRDGGDGGNLDSAALAGVPIFLRDLLVKLPPHKGPAPNIDAYLDQLRRTVLPPRPVTDEDGTGVARGTGGAGLVPDDEGVVLAGAKRGMPDDDDDDDDDGGAAGSRDDIFRKRCRMRMTTD